jgi:hypothetical protein
MSKVTRHYNKDGTVTKVTETDNKIYTERFKPGIILEKGKVLSRSVQKKKK